MSARRTLPLAAVVFACLELASATMRLPRPETVLVPVPLDQFQKIKWYDDPGAMTSTCGNFKAYASNQTTIDRIAGRWYTVYATNIPQTTDYCSHFTNIRPPCGCFGIDFTTAIKEEILSFVLFSSNTVEDSASYEMAVASMNGKTLLNLNDIILRSFVIQPNLRISGKGGFIVPGAVVVDTDDFKSYMILLICKEMGTKPVVMVLVNALPMPADTESVVFGYLSKNKLDTRLRSIDHGSCHYAQNIETTSGQYAFFGPDVYGVSQLTLDNRRAYSKDIGSVITASQKDFANRKKSPTDVMQDNIIVPPPSPQLFSL